MTKALTTVAFTFIILIAYTQKENFELKIQSKDSLKNLEGIQVRVYENLAFTKFVDSTFSDSNGVINLKLTPYYYFIQFIDSTGKYPEKREMCKNHEKILLKKIFVPVYQCSNIDSTLYRHYLKQNLKGFNEAKFKGGFDGLSGYISKNVIYPELALDLGDEGKVYVNFIICTDGSTCNVKIVKGVTDELDKEALRVIRSMPLWIPAIKNGLPIETEYTLPITFRLG